jgi:hypothetical protein
MRLIIVTEIIPANPMLNQAAVALCIVKHIHAPFNPIFAWKGLTPC